MDVLDALDRSLVHALQINGRAPFGMIAAALGVSDHTVALRYRRLRGARILRVVGLPQSQRALRLPHRSTRPHPGGPSGANSTHHPKHQESREPTRPHRRQPSRAPHHAAPCRKLIAPSGQWTTTLRCVRGTHDPVRSQLVRQRSGWRCQ
ncbi:MAG: Lrp/AsnC family transcriptional regulator [Streptosporangiaceae bacterium]